MNVMDRFHLKEKVVLLTGGAGLYGRGLATDLAEMGAILIVASRNREACELLAREETSRGLQVHAETFDQAQETSILELKERILKRFGRVDGLVNNSVARPMRDASGSLSAWEESMRVNATGSFLMHRHFGEIMFRQKSGSIVNIGSIQGMVGPLLSLYDGLPMPEPPPDYFFHKGGIINLTRYYASLLGRHGVRVNCLSPGGFFNNQAEEFVRSYTRQTMLGRMAGPKDLGGSVIFLLSDSSAYITGVNLPVDGGYTAS